MQIGDQVYLITDQLRIGAGIPAPISLTKETGRTRTYRCASGSDVFGTFTTGNRSVPSPKSLGARCVQNGRLEKQPIVLAAKLALRHGETDGAGFAFRSWYRTFLTNN